MFRILILLGLVLPSISVGIRRLHDMNRSGWFYLLGFISIGGIIVLVSGVRTRARARIATGPHLSMSEVTAYESVSAEVFRFRLALIGSSFGDRDSGFVAVRLPVSRLDGGLGFSQSNSVGSDGSRWWASTRSSSQRFTRPAESSGRSSMPNHPISRVSNLSGGCCAPID